MKKLMWTNPARQAIPGRQGVRENPAQQEMPKPAELHEQIADPQRTTLRRRMAQ